MAVSQSLLKRSLQLKVKTGVNAKNNDIYKTLSFARVKTSATPQAIYNVAASLNPLLAGSLLQILVADGSDLTNE